MKFSANQLAATLLVALLSPGGTPQALAQQTASRAQAAQVPAHTANKPLVDEEEAARSTPSNPGAEGIKVHGHWLIDLKDKDGKLLEHRDFHNSLLLSGADILAKLIAGESVMSSLQIDAGGFIIYRPDIANHGIPSCNANPPNAACVPNLTITYTHFDQPNNIPASTVTLNGSITPTTATTVSTVNTSSVACSLSQQPSTTALLTESPARCGALDFDQGVASQDTFFTGTNITPINVAVGQTLAITVILSFY